MQREKTRSGASRPRRRSQRLLISAKVVVRGQRADRTPFEEQTQTVTVNSHGAMILLNAPVKTGQNLLMRHSNAQDEVKAQVIYTGARQAGKTQVGIEFLAPSPRFWRVAFPPDDWTRAQESKNHK
jgi:PilZ domain